jgi:hypothetical protein
LFVYFSHTPLRTLLAAVLLRNLSLDTLQLAEGMSAAPLVKPLDAIPVAESPTIPSGRLM